MGSREPLTMAVDREAFVRSMCNCATELRDVPWQLALIDMRSEIDALRAALDAAEVPRHIDDWHEDYGPAEKAEATLAVVRGILDTAQRSCGCDRVGDWHNEVACRVAAALARGTP